MTIQKITEIDVDGVKVPVTELTEAQQRYVQVYEATYAEKVESENKTIALNAALRALSSDLINSVRAARAAAAAAGSGTAQEGAESTGESA